MWFFLLFLSQVVKKMEAFLDKTNDRKFNSQPSNISIKKEKPQNYTQVKQESNEKLSNPSFYTIQDPNDQEYWSNIVNQLAQQQIPQLNLAPYLKNDMNKHMHPIHELSKSETMTTIPNPSLLHSISLY